MSQSPRTSLNLAYDLSTELLDFVVPIINCILHAPCMDRLHSLLLFCLPSLLLHSSLWKECRTALWESFVLDAVWLPDTTLDVAHKYNTNFIWVECNGHELAWHNATTVEEQALLPEVLVKLAFVHSTHCNHCEGQT